MALGELTTCITALILAMGAAFVLGMYITTQISSWINKNIKKDK
tara:strand:- start:367 stop:498 length:132 start_codon:yes stop_codon:yes gene_type:complete